MKIASYIALLLAAGVTIFSMVKAAGGSIDLGAIGFMAWAISPYLLFAVIASTGGRFKSLKQLPVVTLITALIMLAFSAYVYLSLNGASSTEALVFVFVPLYLHAGGLIIFGVGLATSWLLNKKAS